MIFLLLFIIVLFIASAVRGMVFAHLWQWFVADTFHVQRLSVVQAIGLSGVIALVTGGPNTNNDRKESDPVAALGRTLAMSLFVSAASFLFGLFVVQYL